MNNMYLVATLALQILVAPTGSGAERKTYKPDMVSVPAGSFTMKCVWSFFDRGCYNNAPSIRVVKIKPFQISKHEVTFEQWDSCSKEGDCRKVHHDFWGRGKRPVMEISWLDTQQYLIWLTNKTGKKYRLPTDEEWVYAARAGVKTLFPWGDTASCKNADLYINNQSCHGQGTSVVGSFKPNNFGIYDSIGNVYEWTNNVDPKDAKSRLVRGGSWFQSPGKSSLNSQRYYHQSYRSSDLGFRVALSVP